MREGIFCEVSFYERLKKHCTSNQLTPRSYLHGKPSRMSYIRRFSEIERVVATSWQLRGLRGNYGVYLAVTRYIYVTLAGRPRLIIPRNSYVEKKKKDSLVLVSVY